MPPSFIVFQYAAFLVCLAAIVLSWTAGFKANVTFSSGLKSQRVLVLTAHPDDECMFFSPTITSLTQAQVFLHAHQDLSVSSAKSDVFSFCLSSGDAGGLGEVRKRELDGSLDVLGIVKDNRKVLDEPYVISPSKNRYICANFAVLSFKDNMTAYWDSDLIAQHVVPFVVEHSINIVRFPL